MSLDQNLFTLHFTQNKDNPSTIDLVDPSGSIHYRRKRILGQTYKIEVYDPTSEALLAIASAPASSSKHKTLELHNPTTVIELKYTGTLVFRWTFKWEDYEFEWKRGECYMVRKPDPPVMIAITKEPAGKIKTTVVQILDYNLNRFDINDRKGLEIVILTALLTFQDFNEPNSSEVAKGRTASDTSSQKQERAAGSSSMPVVELTPPPPPPPRPPPKPAPKTGIDRIAEIQAFHGEINEIVVEDEGVVPDYAQYCFNLLQDDAMLFITVKSANAEQVPKVLQVVEEAKRLRYKNGDEELHQYVLYETERQKGPRRINLDDDKHGKNKKEYKPPNSLTIHLSKISMPELQPKTQGGERRGKEEKFREDNKTRKRNSSDSHYQSSTNPSSSLSVPAPANVLMRRKHSSPALGQAGRPPSRSEPSSPQPPTTSNSSGHNTHHAAPPAASQPQPPSQRPMSASIFDFFWR